MMEQRIKYKITTSSLLIFIFFIITSFCQTSAAAQEDVMRNGEEGMEVVQKRRHPILETAMKLFSLPTTFPDPTSYWTKFDSLIQQGRDFFTGNPNLDFRGGVEGPNAGEEGTGEKVREAVVRSVDKSKATLEDTAKSAAKLAGEAVDKATSKLKNTLKNNNQDSRAEPEL